MLWVILPGLAGYAAISLVVGRDVADANEARYPFNQQSPWLRGALWPLFVLAGVVLTLWDIGHPEPR